MSRKYNTQSTKFKQYQNARMKKAFKRYKELYDEKRVKKEVKGKSMAAPKIRTYTEFKSWYKAKQDELDKYVKKYGLKSRPNVVNAMVEEQSYTYSSRAARAAMQGMKELYNIADNDPSVSDIPDFIQEGVKLTRAELREGKVDLHSINEFLKNHSNEAGIDNNGFGRASWISLHIFGSE